MLKVPIILCGAIPGLYSVYFWYCSSNQSIFTINYFEKCAFSIWCWDSNAQPLERESPPITARPGLPPINQKLTSSASNVWSSLTANFKEIRPAEWKKVSSIWMKEEQFSRRNVSLSLVALSL